MQGYIYLIGGGEIARGETKEIDDIIKGETKEKSLFVFFGVAAGDSAGYIGTIQSVFGSKFEVVAATEEKGREFARGAINNASVVYLGGGTTKSLIDLFEKWELVTNLREVLKRGTNIVGMSAGAQALSNWYIHEDNDSMELRQGWGFVPVCLLVHAKEETVEKARALWQRDGRAKYYDFLAIGEQAAWRIGVSGKSKIGPGKVWTESVVSIAG